MHGILIQAWSPVAGGRLFRAEEPVSAEIDAIAQTHDTTREAVAIAWLLRHPAPIQPIIGTLNADRLRATTPADDVELSRVEWYRLLAAARGKGVP